MLITKQRFLRYRDLFYRKVSQSPEVCTIITTAKTSAGSLEDFVGASNRTTTEYTIPVLYNYDIQDFGREKVGLTNMQSAVVYISPLQVLKAQGEGSVPQYVDKAAVLLKAQTTKVILKGHRYIVEKVDFMEPLFDTCIAIQLTLRDEIRG